MHNRLFYSIVPAHDARIELMVTDNIAKTLRMSLRVSGMKVTKYRHSTKYHHSKVIFRFF